ncbi:uncharacterized protein LOC101849629 [Aplysia californica]|uniref:Uncharacterized protein LOC101849629 n=1 Tax=Aplysia californica TaxID=6500 RepID=A0ABM1VXK8_APLCA|nr:uncharacterized protein LOC101849629 [Aplysia californica]
MMDEIRTEVVSDKYTDDDSSDVASDMQGAILWPRRSLLYRICFLALLPIFAIFLLGFSCPFWMKKHKVTKYRGHYNVIDQVDVSVGVWRVCEGMDFGDITDCTSIPDLTSYMMACQSMLCLCLIFTVFSLVFGLYENCATRYDMEDGSEAKTKRPEVNAIIAGVFGMIGIGLYGSLIISEIRDGAGAVQWAFPVTAASVTGLIICGILMAIANPIHAGSPSYPGQVMSLSRQNSSREPSMQDRLVSANSSIGHQSPVTQHGHTLYGVTADSPENRDRHRSELQRSDSFLSSHMSSPDLFTAVSQDPSLSHSAARGAHATDRYDTYVSTADQGSRRQALKQQLQQDRGAQRRSWHFDDRTGAYIVSDLINSRPCPPVPTSSEGRGQRLEGGQKPPVPPRRDKMAVSQTSPSRGASSPASHALQTIPDETADLMLLDDPVVIAPSSTQGSTSGTATNTTTTTVDINLLHRRSTNPFLNEDDPGPPSLQAPSPQDLLQSEARGDSWENQPWPDPPSFIEHVGEQQPTPAASDVSDSTPRESPVIAGGDNVPESLQYQPQNNASMTRKKKRERAPPIPYNGSSSSSTSGGGGVATEPRRQQPRSYRLEGVSSVPRNSARAPAPDPVVPVQKEYDNPLFKSPQTDDGRGAEFVDDFALKICDSTSFVHPLPDPPPYSVVDVNHDAPPQYRRHSSHYSRSPDYESHLGDPQPPYHQPAPQPRVISRDGQTYVSTPSYNNNAKPSKGDKTKRHSASRDKTGHSDKKHNNSGGIKSRPRQVKREHQQRRGQPDSNGQPQQPTSHLPQGYYSSNPDLSSKSPILDRRHRRGESYEHGDYRLANGRATQPPEYRARAYVPDSNTNSRQSPYYANPNSYHWGDSDL